MHNTLHKKQFHTLVKSSKVKALQSPALIKHTVITGKQYEE